MPTQSKMGLYDPRFEHDACGVGFVADLNNITTHGVVEQGIDKQEIETAAVSAVLRWTYRPAFRNGGPAEAWTEAVFEY